MRAARLITMVLLLQNRRTMTAAELAAELEVSERTVARDIQALSGAGVPVYADRGRGGGYRLVGGYRTRLTGLDRSEAEALFLSGVPSALHGMGLAEAAAAARLKVSAALAPHLSGAPDGAARRFHLDAPGWWRQDGTPRLLPEVAAAVRDDLRTEVRYRRRGGQEVVRTLDPHGLILKAGVWYLAARVAGGTGPFRVYRVDRMTGARVTGTRFDRDTGFDLPAFWAERAEEFARSLLRAEAVVRLTPAGARRLPHVTDGEAARQALAAAGPPDARGRVTVTLPVESLEVAHEQLRTLGPEGEVLEPPELRGRMAADARRLADLYGQAATPDAPCGCDHGPQPGSWFS
ncbi:WYL domain-containing protein [Streptomyces sodiiphilus]|uniref:WYL domain-containing protein n=1 Tax=Streptomyces sodiiphilus TaxID=226217 RepID=A0ABP5A228_9ACTN